MIVLEHSAMKEVSARMMSPRKVPFNTRRVLFHHGCPWNSGGRLKDPRSRAGSSVLDNVFRVLIISWNVSKASSVGISDSNLVNAPSGFS